LRSSDKGVKKPSEVAESAAESKDIKSKKAAGKGKGAKDGCCCTVF